MVVQQLVVILVLWQEEMSTHILLLSHLELEAPQLKCLKCTYSNLKLITSFQRQMHKVILIESPVTCPPPSKKKRKETESFYSIEDMNYVRVTLALHLVLPTSEADCSLLKRGLHFCPRICLTKYTQFPSPPLPHPC